MRILDYTYPSPAENLACEDVLLDECDQENSEEVLRFWSPSEYFAVLGYSNKMKEEILPKKPPMPVFRRASGGGTVLQGPGCLNYALVLKIGSSDSLKNIVTTNRFVMQRHCEALSKILKKDVRIQGSTDLTLQNLKFSGNAQRRKRHALLFHGTFLLDFDMALIERTLAIPERKPAYRKNRAHSEFLVNLKIAPEKIKAALKSVWNAERPFEKIPAEKIRELSRSRYASDEWNLKF